MDVLQYYAQNEDVPKYIELKDRKKYDIATVAKHTLTEGECGKEMRKRI
jgi:hypothetical protein